MCLKVAILMSILARGLAMPTEQVLEMMTPFFTVHN
jgi:hypothetical protein